MNTTTRMSIDDADKLITEYFTAEREARLLERSSSRTLGRAAIEAEQSAMMFRKRMVQISAELLAHSYIHLLRLRRRTNRMISQGALNRMMQGD